MLVARPFFLFLLLVGSLFLTSNLMQVFAEINRTTLDIKIQQKGLAIIHAFVDFPTSQTIVFDVLTDYSNWPILFPDGVQVSVEKRPDQWVVIDLSIPHNLIPWTTRLKTKSKGTPPDKVETVLIDGDYLQYEQTWQLIPTQEGKGTLAELKLTLQPKGGLMNWVPDFLYQWTLKGELEDHFEKLLREVVTRSQE